ncbi:MAG: 6-bladed beta-propeller [Thermosulfidibacteraceae bacterium]
MQVPIQVCLDGIIVTLKLVEVVSVAVKSVTVINRIFFFCSLLIFFFFAPYVYCQNGNFEVMKFIGIINRDEEVKKILHPFYVYFDKFRKEIYVVDSKGGRILVYNERYYPLFTLDNRIGITNPIAVATDNVGYVCVLQVFSSNNRETRYKVTVFNRALLAVREILLPHGIITERIAVDSKRRILIPVYRIENKGDKGGNGGCGVLIYNFKGDMIGELKPEEDGKVVPIYQVKVDGKGRIFLVSILAGRIFVYDSDMNFLFKFGEKGGVTGKLSNPKDIGIDEERDVAYVVDYMRHSVSVYDLKEKGRWLFEFGGMGWVEGWFQFPSSLDVGDGGRVYVADTFNSRIQVFEPLEGVGYDLTKTKNRVVYTDKWYRRYGYVVF